MSDHQNANIKELKLARGILCHAGRILMTQSVDGGHYFLPGGKVEAGELVRNALAREMREELGWGVETTDFYGCIENKWHDKRKSRDCLEVNFVFGMRLIEGDLENPKSLEAFVSFHWIDLKDLAATYILPAPLKDILKRVCRDGEKFNAFWQEP
jgi:8-oxo-dGTP pyrophosphatase MutT (NUDIX family)